MLYTIAPSLLIRPRNSNKRRLNLSMYGTLQQMDNRRLLAFFRQSDDNHRIECAYYASLFFALILSLFLLLLH